MWQKGKYGYYVSPGDHTIYWPDQTAWYIRTIPEDIWLKNGDGWSVDSSEFEGAALVAPLPILFWEKE